MVEKPPGSCGRAEDEATGLRSSVPLACQSTGLLKSGNGCGEPLRLNLRTFPQLGVAAAPDPVGLHCPGAVLGTYAVVSVEPSPVRAAIMTAADCSPMLRPSFSASVTGATGSAAARKGAKSTAGNTEVSTLKAA